MGNVIDNVIYHYTSIEVLSKILDNQKIRFTNLSFLNDKSEYIYALQLLKDKISEYETKNHIIDKLEQTLLDKFFFANKLYSVSFSEHEDWLGFWNSYYVPKNEGISIGFKRGKLFPQSEFIINKCVYGDPYPSMTVERYFWFRNLFNNVLIIPKSREFIHITFQTAYIKDKRFEIENEWRAVGFPPKNIRIQYFKRGNNQVPYFDYPININSISDIIIGPSNNQEKIFQEVKKLIKESDISCRINKSTIPFRL